MRPPSPHLHSKKPQPVKPIASPQHQSSPAHAKLADPTHHLYGKTIYSTIYHAIHQPKHKAVKVPVVHVKKPVVPKTHVVHAKKPPVPKKPHVVHLKKPKVVHVKKVHLAKPKVAKVAKPVAAKHVLKKPKDQTLGALPTSHLNPNGTKGPGHIGKHDGPNPYRWSNHPAATMIDAHGHRIAAPVAATSQHRSGAGSVRHAAATSHTPKTHAAPKAPLQLNTDSFLGTDSRVESHRPTPLVTPSSHLMPKPHY